LAGEEVGVVRGAPDRCEVSPLGDVVMPIALPSRERARPVPVEPPPELSHSSGH
jgi:hypothetical protein